jgi:hypothetical protein
MTTPITPPRIDYTRKDYQALVGALLELGRTKLPEWTDQSANDPGVVLTELFAYMGDLVLYTADRTLNEGFLDTAVEARSLVNLLRLIGCELRPSRPAAADLTLLFDPAKTDTVTIPSGAAFETSIKIDNEPVKFRYVGLPLAIKLTDLQPPVVWTDGKSYLRYHTLPVIQADQKVDGEIVASADASPGQEYRLAKPHVVDDTLLIRVDEGGGPVAWTRKSSLLQSKPSDRHYAVRHDSDEYTWVSFGDDRYGHAPARGFNNITADYLVGGGAKGNVPQDTIVKSIDVSDPLQLVSNVKAANGGLDIEPVQEAAARGPRQFRSMDRAVTAEDYESHAKALGVGKARARAASWNRIELFVAPPVGGFPSETLKQDLLRYFEQKRMLTSIVDVRDPYYAPVTIVGELEVEPYVFQAQARRAAETAVQEFMSFKNRRFQDVLHLSKIYEAIEGVQGVSSVNIKQFSRPYRLGDPLFGTNPPDLPKSGKLIFEWDEIPVPQDPVGIVFSDVSGGVTGAA